MTREVIKADATEWYRCSKCEQSFFVKTDDPQKKLLKKSMRCPNYVTCKGRITHRSWVNAGEIRNYRWITAVELYQAAAGLGLFSERDCSPETLRKLIHGSRVVMTDVQETGDPKKSVLLSLTLESGKVLHLASSTRGAIVYKVTEIVHDG